MISKFFILKSLINKKKYENFKINNIRIHFLNV